MGDEMALGYALGQDSNNNGGNGMFGGDGWLGLILFAMIFGNGGWGGGFGGFGGGVGLNGALTRAELYDGFAIQNIDSAVRGAQQGICDSTYALNNSLMSGFHGVDRLICNLGDQTKAGFNAIGNQLSSYCIETQRLMERGFCDLSNASHMQTRDLIDNQNANTRQIMDFLVNSKIEGLQAENQNLKLQASQAQQNNYLAALSEAQTAELIRRIAPTPVPSYAVPAPYPYCGTGYGWGGNNCGCGC